MKTILKQITLLVLLITLFGCAQDESSSFESNLGISDQAETNNIEDVDDTELNTFNRMLIKEGNIEFQTQNIDSTYRQVLNAVKDNQAYISSEKTYDGYERFNHNLVIRVPSQNFEALVKSATIGVKEFATKTIEAQDVTEEFLDVEARLGTKKALEKRFIELLDKANTISEILEIEKQIEPLRSEIESIEGRLKFLKSQTTLSTLNLTYYTVQEQSSQFGEQFYTGFENGWNFFVLFFVMLANIWPFILLISGTIFSVKYYKSRFKPTNKR